MRHLSPVLWTKGTLLAPQHLQAQDRFHDDALAFQLGALTFCAWGLARLEIDREALAGGRFALHAVAARFPDGLLVDAPGSDPPPPARAVADAWGPDRDALVVYLAVPEYRPGGRNVTQAGDAGAVGRWSADERLARDEVTGLTERVVPVARANLRLLLDGESLDGWVALPVARLVRAPGGEPALDPAFVPPLLDVAASDVLLGTARRVVERVAARSAALGDARRQRSLGVADFSVADVGSFWLLYTLNTHLPALRHLADVRRGHPSALWEAMLALAGPLTTFAPAAAPLPAYDHLQLGPRFAALEARLLELLAAAVPEGAASVPLRPVRPGVLAAPVEEAWLSAPQWLLAVSAPLRQPELVSRVVHGCKAGSSDVVDTLIRHALPGLALTHVPQPAGAVPVKLDFQYFALAREGAAWEAVTRARNLALYVPAEVPPEARFELVVVLR
jgi:type VI secretion system protein ImpJ